MAHRSDPAPHQGCSQSGDEVGIGTGGSEGDAHAVSGFRDPGGDLDQAKLPRTLWGVGRGTRADAGDAKVLKTLEDGPFYTRPILDTTLLGHRSEAIHESLSLDRFRNPIIETLLPWRMPRKGW